MARHQFLGDIASWAFALGADETSVDAQSGKRALVIPSASITFWTAQTGGTQYTDLLDSIGTPITSVAADSSGEFAQIQGPDTDPDTWSMWADGSGGAGPRRIVVATDIGDAIPAGLIGTIDTLTALTDLAPVVWRYDEVAAAWNPRPAEAGTRTVFWLGPTPPPIDGTYMLDDVDVFFDWLP
jgi:hypothetical protein